MIPYYDQDSQESILRHARELENSCIEDTLERYSILLSNNEIEYNPKESAYDDVFRGKGRFGQYLERFYFGLETNNESRPDFSEANLELKAAPLKRLKSNNELRAKERIVLGIIDYFRLANEEFESSHLLYKNSAILLVFYIHDNLVQLKNLHVELVDIWRCLKEDYEQIELDWKTIVDKVRTGKAEWISEGDTLLLGACTKGSTAAKSMVSQPYSNNKAMQRAFCFKINYVNYIYRILSERKQRGKRKIFEERLVPPGTQLTIEAAVKRILSPYFNIRAPEIAEINNWSYNPVDKARYARLSAKLLGLDRKNESIHEFNAAGIEVKTVRVQANGTLPESMSFKAIDYCEIVEEEWEDSDFYQSVISKFLIIVFKETDDGEYALHGFKFWNMPLDDYTYAEAVWRDTREKIHYGDYKHFTKQKKPKNEYGIAHVRPHGVKNQVVKTPQGTWEKPKSFWLDKDYVERIITDLI